jgi:DNA-directed RNA polymerase specialized sigma24 family protein
MVDDVDYPRELDRFCGPDEAAARAAMDRLAPRARRYLAALLSDRVSRDDLDELVQTALSKAWESRPAFVNRGRAAWYGWLKRIARNACVDMARGRPAEVGIEALDEVDDGELPLIERFMTAAVGEALFALADSVWLELDDSCPAAQRDRCLLAVQLYYFESWSLDDVLALLSEARPDEPPFTRGRLDSWLEQPANLRLVAYRQLLYAPERLTAHLLGLPPHAGATELERALAAVRAGKAPAELMPGWTAAEAEAILWRYYRGLSAEETAQRLEKRGDSENLDALFVRCGLVFPFRSQCETICAWLDEVDVTGMDQKGLIGDKSGLWRRLAFEYRYRYNQPLRDVHDRIHPAALVVRYALTPEVLNMWISGGRLLDKLRRAYDAREAVPSHA